MHTSLVSQTIYFLSSFLDVFRLYIPTEYCSLLLQAITLILYLFVSVGTCTGKVPQIVSLLKQIEFRTKNDEILLQVQTTCLQILWQPIVFHTKGFFVIDNRTLLSVRFVSNCATHERIIFYCVFISDAWRNHDVHGLFHSTCAKIFCVNSTHRWQRHNVDSHRTEFFVEIRTNAHSSRS